MSVRRKVTEFLIQELHKIYETIPIVQAKQPFSVKFDKYIVVDLLSERNLGDREIWDRENGKIRLECLREATFNIKGLGNGSVEDLSLLKGNLERPTIIDDFFKANVSVTNAGEVMDLTDLINDSRYQEKASIDLTVSYDRTIIDDPGWFNIVIIATKINDIPSGEIVIDKKEIYNGES